MKGCKDRPPTREGEKKRKKGKKKMTKKKKKIMTQWIVTL